jgi:hypothetical protein
MNLLEGFDALPTDTLKEKYLVDFERIMNTGILVTPVGRANWRLTTGKDKDNWQCIKDQTLPNTHVCKFLDEAFDTIATHCIVSHDRRN